MPDIRIVIGGPRNSGKSVFSKYFNLALQDINQNSYYEDYDPFSPTKKLLDGLITPKQRQKQKKKNVSAREASIITKNFIDLSKKYPIVIGDLPGKIPGITKILSHGGTHGIIICREDEAEQIKHWKKLFDEVGLVTVCIIKSNLGGSEIVDSSDLMNVKLTNLERKRNSKDITPNIRVLAEILLPYLQ